MNDEIAELKAKIEVLQEALTIAQNNIKTLNDEVKTNRILITDHTWDCENIFDCPDCGLIREEDMGVIDDEYWCNKCNFFSPLIHKKIAHHNCKSMVTDSSPAPLESLFRTETP